MSRHFLDNDALLQDGCLVLDSLKRKALSGNVPAMRAFLDFAFSGDGDEERKEEQLLSEAQQRRIMDIYLEKAEDKPKGQSDDVSQKDS